VGPDLFIGVTGSDMARRQDSRNNEDGKVISTVLRLAAIQAAHHQAASSLL
jgi:hypothetical protein